MTNEKVDEDTHECQNCKARMNEASNIYLHSEGIRENTMDEAWLDISRRQIRIDNMVWLKLTFKIFEVLRYILPLYVYPGSTVNNSRRHLSPRL